MERFKRWGLKPNLRISAPPQAVFLPFSGFPRCSWHPPDKGVKKAFKTGFGKGTTFGQIDPCEGRPDTP